MKKAGFIVVLKIIFVVGVIGFTVFQLVNFIYKPNVTETVRRATVEEVITVNGIVVREEMVVLSDKTGEINYLVRDGEKVRVGQKIAEIYLKSSEGTSQRLREIESELESLYDLNQTNTLFDADTRKIDSNIKELIKSINADAASRDGTNLSANKQSLKLLLDKKNMILGKSDDLLNKIDALEIEKTSMSAQNVSKLTDVYASRAGCFVYETDGYEETINLKEMQEKRPDQVDNFNLGTERSSVVKNDIGKLITGFKWRLVFAMDAREMDGISIGSVLDMRFPYISGQDMRLRVESISNPYDGKRTVTLVCDVQSDMSNHVREMTAQIVKKSYTGLKIPKEALRNIDGQTGVYALNMGILRFCPINIICEEDTFVLIADDEKQAVRLFDIIVIKGTNLVDGELFG